MSLGPWGRFMVVVIGGLCVIVAVVIVACFVGPGCWGFEYLRREEKKQKLKKDTKSLPIVKVSENKSAPNHWLSNNDYIIYKTGPDGFERKISKAEEANIYHSKERVFNLKCAPLLVAPSTFYPTLKTSSPKLEIKLLYSDLQDGVTGQLTVHVVLATFLPSREYVNKLDPFVLLEIISNKWSFQTYEKVIHVAQTKVVNNSMNPTFNQTFVFNVKKIEIKNWYLKVTVVDDDRLTKATPIFEKQIYLKDVKDLTSKEYVSMNLELKEIKNRTGSLLLGVNYLPTAQRLHISVVKAVNLKYQTLVQALNDFYPFVRVIMLNNHGKSIKKKKTCFRQGENNPIFNSSMIFDLSISNLEQTVFLILLCTKSMCRSSTSENSSLDGDVENSLKESKDKVLGSVVLGRNVKCIRARDHWVAVMQNPRRMISVWHDLT